MQDFQEEIIRKKIERQLSIQKSVETDFSKAYSIVEGAIERGELPEFILEKGKKGEPVGTEKTWGQNRYVKTLKGWKLVERQGKEHKEPEEKKESNPEEKKEEGKEKSVNKEEIKKKIIERLIKVGNNPDDVKKMVDKHFEYALKTYPNSSVKEIANVIRTIY